MVGRTNQTAAMARRTLFLAAVLLPLAHGFRSVPAPPTQPRWRSGGDRWRSRTVREAAEAEEGVAIGSAPGGDPDLITEPFDSNALSMRLILGSETGEIGFLAWPETELKADFSKRYNEGDQVLITEGSAICQISEFNDGVSNEPPFLVSPGCLLEFNEPCAMSWELQEPEVKFLAPGLGELGQYAITTGAVLFVLLILIVTQS